VTVVLVSETPFDTGIPDPLDAGVDLRVVEALEDVVRTRP